MQRIIIAGIGNTSIIYKDGKVYSAGIKAVNYHHEAGSTPEISFAESEDMGVVVESDIRDLIMSLYSILCEPSEDDPQQKEKVTPSETMKASLKQALQSEPHQFVMRQPPEDHLILPGTITAPTKKDS